MKRLTFWGGVFGMSILANFVLELVSDRVSIPGLAKFTAYTHKGCS